MMTTSHTDGFTDRYYTEFEMKEEIRIAYREGVRKQAKVTLVAFALAAVLFVIPVITLAIQQSHLTGAQRVKLEHTFN